MKIRIVAKNHPPAIAPTQQRIINASQDQDLTGFSIFCPLRLKYALFQNNASCKSQTCQVETKKIPVLQRQINANYKAKT